MRFASYERSECFIEVVRLLLHIDEVDVSLKNIRVVILTSKHKKSTFESKCFFLSKLQAWYIIDAEVRRISSAPLGLYLITRQRVSYLRLDDIQHCVLMIYNASH